MGLPSRKLRSLPLPRPYLMGRNARRGNDPGDMTTAAFGTTRRRTLGSHGEEKSKKDRQTKKAEE